ncbi:MAG: murein transglycosylase A [Sphingomonadales bacterium]|nr:murein transglycosylase A [Sphingomonadales bacterium]MDE2568720.1 murein transglycosylase A [Sphingomonadales bacterium]
MRPGGIRALAALGLLVLASCARIIPPAQPPLPPPPATALTAGVRQGPIVAGLGFANNGAARALSSFAESCPRLLKRSDASGLTRPEDWQPACAAAVTWPASEASGFFATFFESAEVGTGDAFATGYFEPQIAGSREHLPGYDVPVYGLPPDLVRAAPGDAPPAPSGRQPLGRYDESGKFVPYYTRAEIDAGALAGKGLEIGWAKDPIDFFFLQIQGSGRLVAPDGSVMRIGYAGQNGQPYTGIGKLMRERGLFGDGPGQYPGSMQGIVQYLRDHPAEGRALMDQNASWVFFKELTGGGPLGALGVPVRGSTSVAADPAFVPLGAPVVLEGMDNPQADGLWVAQDTGGAIKGANRFDTFWGAGDAAKLTAGGMSAHGRALLLLPKGTVARLNGQ